MAFSLLNKDQCVCAEGYARMCIDLFCDTSVYSFGLWYLLFNIKRSWIKNKAIGDSYILLTWSGTKLIKTSFVLETRALKIRVKEESSLDFPGQGNEENSPIVCSPCCLGISPCYISFLP